MYTVDENVNWCSDCGKEYGGFSKINLKIELPYDSAIPLLGIYLEKMKTLIWKDTCTPMFIAALFIIAKTLKQSVNRWMDKEAVVHIYNGILLSHQIEWSVAICSNMNRPRNYHTKWSKSGIERQILYDITYMWNLKNNTNGSIYKTETDSQT